MKMSVQPIKIALTVAGSIIINNTAPVWTHPAIQLSQNLPAPPKTGTPTGPQTGGSTRPGASKCPAVDVNAIAFIPKTGQFVLENPTFWFYIPFAAKDVDSISFVILNEDDEYVQPPKKLALSGTPGFIRLRLPSTLPPLEIGKNYKWSFSIYCDRQNQEDRISMNGVFQKIAPNLTTGTPRERIARYMENGFWFDALNLLGELRINGNCSPQLRCGIANEVTNGDGNTYFYK